MEKFVNAINKGLATMCGYLLILVMCMVTIDVIIRNLGYSFLGIQELTIFIVVAVIYMGVGYCEQVDGHVRVGLLLDRLSPKASAFMRVVVMVMVLAIMVVAAYALSIATHNAYLGNEAVMAGRVTLYTWPTRAIMAFSSYTYCLQLFFNLLKEIRNFRSPNPSHDPIRDFTI